MLQLLDLPYEILGFVFSLTDPSVWTAARLTCRMLHDFIDQDYLIYKEYYLRILDPPRTIRQREQWKEDVMGLVKFKKILESRNRRGKLDQLEMITSTAFELIQNACSGSKSKNIDFLRKIFEDEEDTSWVLCHSPLYRTRSSSLNAAGRISRENQMACAKLHSYHGKALQIQERSLISPYSLACSKVFDLRHYSTKTLWGPFKADASREIDWEMIEAIMVVLTRTIRQSRIFTDRFFQPVWNLAFGGVTSLPLPEPESNSKDESPYINDPYGITGTWIRILCILEFDALTQQNAIVVADGEELPPFEADLVLRMVQIHLNVTSTEPPGPDDGQALPIVHFTGKSRTKFAGQDPNAPGYASVRGSVRLTKQGEVHWTTWSMYMGEERWRSEGIQVGGLQAARGVLGCWFDKNYNAEGPVGPTALWKIDDDPDFNESEIGLS